MTRAEFTKIMAYLSAGFRTEMGATTIEVYYDLLGGFPAGIVQAAVKKVLRERMFPSLPTVAEVLKAIHCFHTFGRTPDALSDQFRPTTLRLKGESDEMSPKAKPRQIDHQTRRGG